LRKAAKHSDLDAFVAKGWHKLAGFENPDDYIQMMKALKRSGTLDNMLALMKNEYGPRSAMGAVGRTVEGVREAGRVFVNEAERWNKAIAWQIAWRQIAEKYPAMKVGSPAFVEKTSSLASTFALNMDQAGAAAWQKNFITKIPTQFMPYMFRWHEIMLNPDWTKTQKIRFFTGQAFWYGTAGIPFAAYAASEFNKANGETPDIRTTEGAIQRGFLDTLIFYTTGADVAFSESAGIGAYPTDIIQEFW